MATEVCLTIAHTFSGVTLTEPLTHTSVRLSYLSGFLLVTIDAPLYGDPLPRELPGITPYLWNYEVVELFLAAFKKPTGVGEGEKSRGEVGASPLSSRDLIADVPQLNAREPNLRYLELEFGPRGHYLVLQLAGYRRMVKEQLALDYQIEEAVAGKAARWRGRAKVPLSYLELNSWPLSSPGAEREEQVEVGSVAADILLKGNAYAIHGESAGRVYLAAFPGYKQPADFHDLSLLRTLALG